MTFGFLIATIYVPGIVGAALWPQWSLLSAVLPFKIARIKFDTPTIFFAAFIGYAALSLLWSPNFFDALYGFWQYAVLFLVYLYARDVENPMPLFHGIGLGLSLSSLLSIVQYAGFRPVLQTTFGAPGLFYNSMVHGEALALALILFLLARVWIYVPFLIPGIVLSNSRAVIVALGIALLANRLRRPWLMLLIAALGGLAMVFSHGQSDIVRLQVWHAFAARLSLFGDGVGATITNAFFDGTNYIKPETAHNDAMQLLFEFGIGAVPMFAFSIIILRQTRAIFWPVFVAFVVMGFFSFPLFTPVTAFFGLFAAGLVCRDGDFNVRA